MIDDDHACMTRRGVQDKVIPPQGGHPSRDQPHPTGLTLVNRREWIFPFGASLVFFSYFIVILVIFFGQFTNHKFEKDISPLMLMA